MFRTSLKVTHFAWLMSFLTFLFFHYAFFKFVFENIDYTSFNGILAIVSLVALMLIMNALLFYLFLYPSRYLGKFMLVVFFLANAISVYFVNTYGVIIDKTMIGNVINTNFDESSSFFSLKLIVYVFFLGILPSIFIVKAKLQTETFKRFLINCGIALAAIATLILVNASNWLWIDKHSKQLGGLAMPWSYSVNLGLYYSSKSKANKKEILLPNATAKDNQKSVVVLVIGESARKQNFSLYGYAKNTNPLLSKVDNLHHFDATSCATYTTATLKCILEHTHTNDLYEILPNYLYRNNFEVIWRTTNSGEPPIHIKNYQTRATLSQQCEGEGCNYDEILLSGLKEQILASDKDKILVVLHTSTSHGPTYSKKYPPRFETFSPVCNSVELGNCSNEELINAYDNSIIYTDYLLSQVINELKLLSDFQSSMLFVSDHGESLGEKNLYMHGVPMSIAPKEQYEIPFIVWTSENSQREYKVNGTLSQNHVFHSVLDFLHIDSPIYTSEMSIFK